MEYILAFVIFIFFFVFTTRLTAFLGLLIPIIYAILGFILGYESLIIGIGGLLGSLYTYYLADKYIRTFGAMSHAPRYTMTACRGFILVFIITIIAKYAFKVKMDNINYWYLLIFAFIAWIVLTFILNSNRTQSLNNFNESVVKYKIVERYNEDPKWATFLYFENGKEQWSQTIPGSFRAKDPVNDLTFVHPTKEDALRYAKFVFTNAEYLEDEYL
jgi:hypothetical protein